MNTFNLGLLSGGLISTLAWLAALWATGHLHGFLL